MITLGELLREYTRRLADGGGDNPRFEARQLIEKACGAAETDFVTSPERPVSAVQLAAAEGFISRRLTGEPLQYILGEWEFYGLPFIVGEGVLIPRQDTETVAGLALEYAAARKHGGFLALDLCAGSGCIGITLAKLAGVPVKLVELSEKALGYLRGNIVLNGAESLCEAVRADALSERTAAGMPPADLIVTNPPYLSKADMGALQTEVGFEPREALYGGEDGLDYYRRMLPLWAAKLKPGGMLAAEIGMGQERAVMRIFEECEINAQLKKDLCGVIRVVYGIKE